MAEVFFGLGPALYRPEGESYAPTVFRSLNDRLRPAPIDRAALDQALPPEAPPAVRRRLGGELVGPGLSWWYR